MRVTIVADVTSEEKQAFSNIRSGICQSVEISQGALAALALRLFIERYRDDPMKALEDASISLPQSKKGTLGI
ncbi:hypothetical protein [Sphingomonas azotifigens]|uniref:hypothetical protein n=1 Tax=Sphingomonas azotifigens TaxID=330920 RepID=UPI00111C21DC|nr:hypothetical protein [Sphingomonas azotifigens]